MQTGNKSSLRKEIIALRDRISPDEKKRKDSSIFERIVAHGSYTAARTVLLYASFRSEVETDCLIRHSLDAGKRTVLPLVDRTGPRLRLYAIENMEDLLPGCMGIREPKMNHAEVVLDAIDFVLVPGVAFDLKCGRIGYGGGYYDRLLQYRKAGLFLLSAAYEEQIVETVPVEAHDVKMDEILTEERILRCIG